MTIRDGVTEFVSVVETESFTAAAKSLDVSVAHISRHVNQLEERLGAKLLYRTTRKLRLTEVGEVYYHYARKVLDDLSFEVKKGEVFVIVGPSGTGKSVTLKHMVRLLTPT
ncbi:MAG: LysR family transcriptional regulator, partial [Citrobacter sp.]|nr:LysR family transcriptional regulator [Citrobacter sp.]